MIFSKTRQGIRKLCAQANNRPERRIRTVAHTPFLFSPVLATHDSLCCRGINFARRFLKLIFPSGWVDRCIDLTKTAVHVLDGRETGS